MCAQLRTGKRHKSHALKKRVLPPQAPFKQPRLRIKPIEFISADELESIHLASLHILETIGIQVTLPQAVDIFRKAGAEILPDQIVKIPRQIIENNIHTAPPYFTLHARNAKHNLIIGKDYLTVGSVGSPPNSYDLKGGRRSGNQKDFRDFLKLSHHFNICHLTAGFPVEPTDIPVTTRHLDCSYDFITMTDKVFHVYSLGKERNRDVIEMTRIARQATDEQMDSEPSLFSVINSNSPLKLDGPMLQGIIEMSSRNQVIVFTPFTLAGAMAPVTLAGALAEQNAEALVGLLLTQLVRPGAPFVYGGFTSNVDMKSGAPAFGTPEYMKACLIGGQLARRYKVPYRSSNVCSANSLDAQAAYEAVFSLWGAVMGGTNYLKHGLGWMEGGLQASFEKFIMDVELLQMVASFLEPISLESEEFGFEAIAEASPAGHFFGTEHTLKRYDTAFYMPILSDLRNYETWQEAGEPTVPEKAHNLYRSVIDAYEPPPLDAAVHEELMAFVAKRKEEGGAPPL